MRPSILSDCPSVPILGSKLVGIDSIRKLTTPGSVWTEGLQEESARTRRREVKETKEVKENISRSAQRIVKSSDPLLRAHPLSPPPPRRGVKEVKEVKE